MDLSRFLDELAAWAEERDPGFETVAYGGHPDHVVDVRRGGDRVAILIHGGFWRPLHTRSNMRALAVDLVLRGWTTWNIEYRRTGVVDTLSDVRAALSATGPGTAIGHSAGGHLALWAAAGSGAIVRAVSLAGVTDLARAARERIGDGAAVEFAGADPPPDADPMQQLPLAAPVLLVHGDADDRVPVDYSRAFAAASGCEYLELRGAGHFEVIDPRTDEWAQIVARL